MNMFWDFLSGLNLGIKATSMKSQRLLNNLRLVTKIYAR